MQKTPQIESEDEYEDGSGSEYEDDEDGEGESGSSEYEEEEEEPPLKYQRVGNDVTAILQKETATCLAIHEKMLFLGTSSGLVYMLSIQGHENHKFNSHLDAPVREISIDKAAEFVASCSDDGKVVIHDVMNKSIRAQFSFNRPITSVAIDPDYAKNKKDRFVCGGKAGELTQVEKGFFGHNQSILHKGEGQIHAIGWGTGFIAWANDIGVKIYDCATKERITYIGRPRGSPRPELYRCCLCWESPISLIIGWADTVIIAQIREREKPVDGLPSRYAEILHSFQTNNYFICGISPFKQDLMIVAFVEDQKSQTSKKPELHIVSRDNNDISTEVLSINDYERCTSLDYRLGHCTAEQSFYLLSPKDVVIAKPRDLDDHIAWLLERKEYEEALKSAEGHEHELRKHDIVIIGEKYLYYLLGKGQSQKAAESITRILRGKADKWEIWVFNFTKNKVLKDLGPYIPIENPRLSPTCYETVLSHFLDNDPAMFLKKVETWPPSLYNLSSVIAQVEEKIKRSKVPDELKVALAKLYTYNNQFDKTLHIYLQLKKGDVFELIKEHDLFSSVGDKVLELMRFDDKKATDLLIQNIDRIPVTKVYNQLKSEEKLLLTYLHALFYQSKKNEAGKEYHNRQVELYAEHDREHLLEFLQKSSCYNLDSALEVCKKKNYYKEMVFIYERMGNTEETLTLMIDKVGDVKQAIEYVQKQNDDNLWDQLIQKSIRNPVFVSGLLENVGTHLYPLKLIQQIPKGMEIIGLRDRLVKIINDYLLQTSLSQGCKEVLHADVITLSQRYYRGIRRGIRVQADAKCESSNVPILGVQKKPVVVFFCNHVYYADELTKLSGSSNRAMELHCPQCCQAAESDVKQKN